MLVDEGIASLEFLLVASVFAGLQTLNHVDTRASICSFASEHFTVFGNVWDGLHPDCRSCIGFADYTGIRNVPLVFSMLALL